MKRLAIGALAICAMFGLHAKYRRISSERALDKHVSRNKFVVAMFYELGREQRKDRELRRKIENMKRMFKQTSNRSLYEASDTDFVSGNISKRDLSDTTLGLNIKQLPAFVLYYNGVVFKSQGVPAVLTGFVSREQLMQFIDKNLEKEMRKYAKWRAKERRRRAWERSLYGPYFYTYPYGWYYPYGGIGFGWGWGYPYYRGWW